MTLEELSKLIESKRNPVVINKGITPLSLLGIAFIVLKIMGYINWSWIWVLSPFWVPFCLAVISIVVCLLIMNSLAKCVKKTTMEEKQSKEVTEDSINKTSKRKSKKNLNGEENTRSSEGENV